MTAAGLSGCKIGSLCLGFRHSDNCFRHHKTNEAFVHSQSVVNIEVDKNFLGDTFRCWEVFPNYPVDNLEASVVKGDGPSGTGPFVASYHLALARMAFDPSATVETIDNRSFED